MRKYVGGALPSPYDIRTFSAPTKAEYIHTAGIKYPPKNILNQHSVGTCTSTSLAQHGGKALNKKWSDDFQYLCQKKFYDQNWTEGSSAFHGVKTMHQIGLLPKEEWTWTTEADKKLTYTKYIEKLQSIPEAELNRCIAIANKYKIKGYARLKDTTRDTIAEAIGDHPNVGVIARFNIGNEWWTNPIEPIRKPIKVISGHLCLITRVVGNSFRIANTWGTAWADEGTAYYIHTDVQPTEAWVVYYNELPPEIQEQKDSRETIKGQILDLLQQIISLIVKL